jgi:hypothetical protein
MKSTKYTSFVAALMLLLALTATVTVHSQDSVRTLIRPGKIRSVGIYVAPEFQYGQLDNTFTAFSGGSAMLLFNRRFAVGVTGQHLIDRSFSPSGVAPLVVRAGFGGGKLEYTLHPEKAIHLSFPLVLGMGMARADSVRASRPEFMHDHNDGQFDGRRHGGSDYWVVQPGVQLEANLLRNVQVFAGVNYRISGGANNDNTTLSNNVMQGVAVNAGVKVGFFSLFSPGRHHRGHTPPPAVLHSFMEQFPLGTEKVRWRRERRDEWEAEFKLTGVETSANFSETGQWLETETEITRAELPAALQTATQNVKAKEITRIKKADGKTLYEIRGKR